MNKLIGSKPIKYFIIAILIIVGLAFFPKLYEFMKYNLNRLTVDNEIIINTGLLNQDPLINTGSIITVTGNDSNVNVEHLSDYEKYKGMKKINFLPNKQPQNIPTGYSYNDRSKLLVEYLSKNTLQFILPEPINSGYLYIRTSVYPTNGIFLYLHNTKVSGELILNKSLYTGGKNEYLFSLSQLPIIDYYTKSSRRYNFINDLVYNGKPNFIGGFSKSFDGNYIEEISIARK